MIFAPLNKNSIKITAKVKHNGGYTIIFCVLIDTVKLSSL